MRDLVGVRLYIRVLGRRALRTRLGIGAKD